MMFAICIVRSFKNCRRTGLPDPMFRNALSAEAIDMSPKI